MIMLTEERVVAFLEKLVEVQDLADEMNLDLGDLVTEACRKVMRQGIKMIAEDVKMILRVYARTEMVQ